jgi:hypothetical protein
MSGQLDGTWRASALAACVLALTFAAATARAATSEDAGAVNGAPCTGGDACTSGFCVDAVCCDTACSGQCEACDVTQTVGRCTAVVGAPHGPRPGCSGADAGNPCAAAQCDGVDTSTCSAFAGATVSCGAATCANGTETFAGTCDGLGNCKAPAAVSCEAYACGATACNATCTVSTDCTAGAVCDVSSAQCIPAASTCDGAHTITSANGVTVDCSPYDCEPSGTCALSCTGDAQCIAGYVCNAGLCVSGATETMPGAGNEVKGACEASRSPAGGCAALVAIAALFALKRRRLS